jgi:hypothetical protein
MTTSEEGTVCTLCGLRASLQLASKDGLLPGLTRRVRTFLSGSLFVLT